MAFRGPHTPDRTARALALGAILLGLFLVAWARLGLLQLGEGARFRELADQNSIRLRVAPAPRGEIYDRTGIVLATSLARYTVTVDPHQPLFQRRPQMLRLTLARLAPVLGVPDSVLVARVEGEARKSLRPIRVAEDIPIATIARLEGHRDELPGVEIEILPVRSYPRGALASHVLGYSTEISEEQLVDLGDRYVPGDLYGQAGLERSYEEWLRGRDGESLVEVSAFGRIVGETRDHPGRPPQRGHSLHLTLDARLQAEAESALVKWPRVSVVAMDPRTGAILAMASRPGFDPNEFSHGISTARWADINQGGSFPMLNRAIQAAYPPGSIFKLVTAATALRGDLLDAATRFASCAGGFNFGHRFFKCWQHSGHGSLVLREAIARSCDTYFYQVGLRVGLDRLSEEARDLGLGQKTGVDLPSERRGHVPTAEWYDRRYGKRGWTRAVLLNLAIGQGELLLSPLQIASVAAQIGNGGNRVTPYLVETVTDVEGRVFMRHKVESHPSLSISPEQLRWLQEGMLAATGPGGTAGLARVAGVNVCAKTGTAQNPHGQDHAVFMAYAPAEDPRIAVGIVVENGGHGGSAAAPIAKRILEAWLKPEAGRLVRRPEGTGLGNSIPAPVPAPVDSAAADTAEQD